VSASSRSWVEAENTQSRVTLKITDDRVTDNREGNRGCGFGSHSPTFCRVCFDRLSMTKYDLNLESHGNGAHPKKVFSNYLERCTENEIIFLIGKL